jgi:D-3-phosphoglycerate dehydrogenase
VGKHKVLIPQPIAREGVQVLEDSGYTPVILRSHDRPSILAHAADCSAILVRTAVIDRQIIEKASALKVIARHGVGLDNIDLRAASERGIYVCNTPHANSNSVAEHTIGLMIAVAHQIVRADKALRQGKFHVRNQYIGTELAGKQLGLIGFGNIGRKVAEKAALGLGMKAVVYDPYLKGSAPFPYVQLQASLEELLATSDFVSLHLPYSERLHHFINAEAFGKMKKGAIFVNAARGGLVDEQALCRALRSGHLAGAGLDCFEQEPPPDDHPFWQLERVVVTPHMAAHSQEAIVAMAVEAAQEIVRVLEGAQPKFWANRERSDAFFI